MDETTPHEWVSILKRVIESQENKVARQYIVAKDGKYYTTNQAQTDQLPDKLTLLQIVEISVAKLKKLQKEYLQNGIKETDYIDLTNDIADYTLKLIDAHETERDHTIKQVLRRIALVISALLSLVIIGIPFFLKLRNEDKQFKAEIDQLKYAILQAAEVSSQAILIKKLDHLPSMLEGIKKRYTDHRRQELINDQMLVDWLDYERIPAESRLPYDAEFAKDIQRGACFQRIDQTLNIEDKNRIPLSHLDSNQCLKQATSSLEELLKQPEDQRWSPILQFAITHASFITAFQAILSAINIDMANVQWETNGKPYSIKSVFSDDFPPVILEIMRYSKTGTIEKVNVTIKGGMDIMSYNTLEHEEPKMIVPDAITEELNYSIVFNKDNRPMIIDLHSKLKINVFISKNKE